MSNYTNVTVELSYKYGLELFILDHLDTLYAIYMRPIWVKILFFFGKRLSGKIDYTIL